MMTWFGAPVPQADHAVHAVRCALAMQRALAELDRGRERAGMPALAMGIGVHGGRVGAIGAPRRREYTPIGDAVNVAFRIQELGKAAGSPILVSDATRRQVGAALGFVAAGRLALRGRSEGIDCWVPAPDGGPASDG